MMRNNTDRLNSNSQSTPIVAFQDRGFREEYFKASASYHRGRHEFKAGMEADFTQLREGFADTITDLSQFDPATPPALCAVLAASMAEWRNKQQPTTSGNPRIDLLLTLFGGLAEQQPLLIIQELFTALV